MSFRGFFWISVLSRGLVRTESGTACVSCVKAEPGQFVSLLCIGSADGGNVLQGLGVSTRSMTSTFNKEPSKPLAATDQRFLDDAKDDFTPELLDKLGLRTGIDSLDNVEFFCSSINLDASRAPCLSSMKIGDSSRTS